MNPTFFSALLAPLVGVAMAYAAHAKSPLPADTPAPPVLQPKPPPSLAQTMPGDPGNLLKREIAVPMPPTVAAGQVAGIGYWSYVYNNENTTRYCVEPKLFTCGPSSAPVSWSPPPVLELLNAADATLYAISLPQTLPLKMLNANNSEPTFGPKAGSRSLVQWCATGTNFPNWKIKLGNHSQVIDWNTGTARKRAPIPSSSPC
jgi:hypothetical protein